MVDPKWVKPATIGVAVGATVGVVIFGAVKFTLGGWMTTGGADRMCLAGAHETKIAAMVPVCLDLVANDPDRESNLRIGDRPRLGTAEPRPRPGVHQRARAGGTGMTSQKHRGGASQAMTELEQRVAANEKTESDGSGDDDVRVAKRHGICVRDDHDLEVARAAAG